MIILFIKDIGINITIILLKISGAFNIKKTFILLTAVALGATVWSIHRNKKYPLAKGYRPFNKVVINGSIINIPILKFANKILEKEPLPSLPNELISKQININTRDNKNIKLTIYKPNNIKDKQPCLIYYHGGGFFIKDEAYIHRIVMKYAINAKCTVVFVHYRTSDKYPFPIPFYDCADAIEYIWKNADELNIDKDRIAVGGDSAGGCLGASITHYCKKHNIPLCFQMLIYPVIDANMNSESTLKYKDGPLWNSTMSKRMWEIYLRDGINDKEEYASPILAKDFTNLPRAYIETCEFDSLSDEGNLYAKILKENNIPVELSQIEGGIHGFDFIQNTKLTKDAIIRRSNALYNAFYKQ